MCATRPGTQHINPVAVGQSQDTLQFYKTEYVSPELCIQINLEGPLFIRLVFQTIFLQFYYVSL